MINKVILIGNLGADPELRQTNSGTAVCNLRLATNERRKGADGEWGDHTEWHRIVCFGRTAENCNQYLSKGRRVYVEGRLTTRKWEDKEGRDRWTTEIVAYQVKFLGGQGEGGGNYGGSSSYGGGSSTSTNTEGATSGGGFDDDIPF